MLVRRPGAQSEFQFIPNVGLRSGLCTDYLSSSTSNLGKPSLHGAQFMHRSIVMLERNLGLYVPVQ